MYAIRSYYGEAGPFVGREGAGLEIVPGQEGGERQRRDPAVLDLVLEHLGGAPEDRGGARLGDRHVHRGHLGVIEALQQQLLQCGLAGPDPRITSYNVCYTKLLR